MGYLKKTSFIWEEDWIEDFPKREDCRLKSQVKYSVAKELHLRTRDSTLTCILDQLPGQISEIQAFAPWHVEVIYYRRSSYLVDNFVHIQVISVYYPSLNHIALPKKLKDNLKVYVYFSSIVSAYIFNYLLIYYYKYSNVYFCKKKRARQNKQQL